MTDPEAVSKSGARAAFAHRDYRLHQLGRFLVTIATQMQSVAIAWQVYSITHRPVDLGFVGLAEFVPVFGLALVAGHVADRLDRRKIIVASSVCIALCALLFLAIAQTRVGGVWAIYGVIVVFGVGRAFNAPASQALMPSLVPTADFPNAVAWSASVWQVATIAGPALGGVVYGAFGPSGVYAASACISLAAAVTQSRIRARPLAGEKRAASWSTFLAGIVYVRKNRALLGSISLDLFAVLLGGATALLPVFASDVLHIGAWGLGILRSAPALGASVMAIAIAHRPLQRHAGKVMLACVFVFGIATVVFGLSKSFPLSFVALVVLGASDMVSVMVRSIVVQLRTPPEMRGRVSAVNSMFVVASNELGEFESGITAGWFGTIPAVVLGGIGSCLVVVLYALLFPELRDVDRLDEEKPA